MGRAVFFCKLPEAPTRATARGEKSASLKSIEVVAVFIMLKRGLRLKNNEK
jgi:hypothetical protein